MPQATALRLSRLRLVVADLGRARAFYEALGFRSEASEAPLSATEVEARFRLAGTKARHLELHLGAQAIELLAFDPGGQPYPRPAAANDPWFQHFAIAVCDMEAAYAVLTRLSAEPISNGGPQRLPPSTGSVTAYKFRDPDGHPLELSYIPNSAWATTAADSSAGPFLGIDHTALAVSDMGRSLAFYTGRLGFTLDAQLVNSGPEQDRLDGLPEVVLDIAVLRPADPASPHLELLSYRTPCTVQGARRRQPNDIAATGSQFAIENFDCPAGSLAFVRVATSSRVPVDRVIVDDPDGHTLELIRRD